MAVTSPYQFPVRKTAPRPTSIEDVPEYAQPTLEETVTANLNSLQRRLNSSGRGTSKNDRM